ncbi:MAG: hypothetical protein JSW39_22745 [Desulfobacterales bacterium]|nr:MAG: hypothetical protein JSW39_22745 [Desulfobacterales bacterium]
MKIMSKPQIRTKEIHERLQAIEVERERCQAGKQETASELERLRASLDEIMRELQTGVKAKMDELFNREDTSAKRIVDRVFTMKMHTTESRQLEENIAKLEGTLEWYNEKLNSLRAEEASLQQELNVIEADEHLKAAHENFEYWLAEYFECERGFNLMKAAIQQARQLLKNQTTERALQLGFTDPTFQNLIDNRLRDGRKSMLRVVEELAKIYSIPGNPFYNSDPQSGDDRRDQRGRNLIREQYKDKPIRSNYGMPEQPLSVIQNRFKQVAQDILATE